MRPHKVIPRRNYGSIPHLHGSKLGEHDRYLQEGQNAIIHKGGRDKHDELYVSLKLDGTNVGVVLLDGKPQALQRKGYNCISSPYRMHHEFDAWVQAYARRFTILLEEGERVAGEWVWQTSGIHYAVSGDPFFPFDIFRADNTRLPWKDMVARTESIGLRPPAWEQLPHLTGTNNVLQVHQRLSDAFPAVRPLEGTHEGIVARIERRECFDFMGKWVRPDFEPGKYLPGLNDDSPTEDLINKLLPRTS